MAYKDVLVYLDPSAEAIKRLRFAADLANAHGARLIAVDASAPAVAEGIDPMSATRRMFDDATGGAGLKTVFTTPAHGTAYDIVGQGKADTGALEQALRIATKMAAAKMH